MRMLGDGISSRFICHHDDPRIIISLRPADICLLENKANLDPSAVITYRSLQEGWLISPIHWRGWHRKVLSQREGEPTKNKGTNGSLTSTPSLFIYLFIYLFIHLFIYLLHLVYLFDFCKMMYMSRNTMVKVESVFRQNDISGVAMHINQPILLIFFTYSQGGICNFLSEKIIEK